MAFEVIILKAIYDLVGTSGFVDGLFVFCAKVLPFIATLIFLAELLVHREPYERLTKIFYTGLALIISTGILQGICGYVISRNNPASVLGFHALVDVGETFPSFATTWAVTVAIVASATVSKRLGFWLILLAIVIGFSQLYVGLSWPLDIAVSFIIGIVGPFIAGRIIPPPAKS